MEIVSIAEKTFSFHFDSLSFLFIKREKNIIHSKQKHNKNDFVFDVLFPMNNNLIAKEKKIKKSKTKTSRNKKKMKNDKDHCCCKSFLLVLYLGFHHTSHSDCNNTNPIVHFQGRNNDHFHH